MPGPQVKLRRATQADIGYLSGLGQDPDVEPFLSPGAAARERLESLLAGSTPETDGDGLLVIEAGCGEPLGGLALQLVSRNSRICELTRLMVDVRVRRSGVGTTAVRLACGRALVDQGFHRVQAETYGDNVGGQRLFERAGFTREGLRRRAYWRRNQWLDGVLFGLLAEELRDGGPPRG